jgi:nitrite reductase/ring-hydroxylating ferredoxin subunit
MDLPSREFVLAGSLEELKAKGRFVLHGDHRPILVIYDRGRVFALDNRCPHMGFPLERGSIEDGILTCHWHHARFDLESGCTFDLWADDVPTFPIDRDYEARSRLVLKSVGTHRFAADASTEILCCAYAVDDQPVQLWTPGDPVQSEFVEAANNPDWIVAAHGDRCWPRNGPFHLKTPSHASDRANEARAGCTGGRRCTYPVGSPPRRAQPPSYRSNDPACNPHARHARA